MLPRRWLHWKIPKGKGNSCIYARRTSGEKVPRWTERFGGQNGAGKTGVISAIRQLFNDSESGSRDGGS